MTLSQKLKAKKAKLPSYQVPLWTGPDSAGPNGGVTQGLLQHFLCCRERFRLRFIEGLAPGETFNHRLEYGNFWHLCEESLAAGKQRSNKTDQWQPLTEYCQELCRRFPFQQEQIEQWYSICKVQFPIYVQHWQNHPDVVRREPIYQEQTFDIAYRLPSGRRLRLRGKWDSVDRIREGKTQRIVLKENKVKGDIREDQLRRQLSFDLQTMFYLTALTLHVKHGMVSGATSGQVNQLCYNVVRRPLSGGKDSIRQHKPSKSNPQGETKEEFYARLGGLIAEDPEHYFMRWNSTITQGVGGDVDLFQKRFLNPIGEQLWDWWEAMQHCDHQPWSRFSPPKEHWQFPFGVWNALVETGATDMDECVTSGSEVGLVRRERVFPELEI